MSLSRVVMTLAPTAIARLMYAESLGSRSRRKVTGTSEEYVALRKSCEMSSSTFSLVTLYRAGIFPGS